MFFSWITIAMSVIYNILGHDIPSHVWDSRTYVHMLYWFIFFQAGEVNEGGFSYVYTSVTLINQVFVICYFKYYIVSCNVLCELFYIWDILVSELLQV